MRSLLLISTLCALAHIVLAQQRILLLVDNNNIEKTHSIFLKSLRDRGYTLTVKKADDASLSLTKFGEFLYDHVIVFAPSVEGNFKIKNICISLEFGGSINAEELARFVDGGGNVLVAADSNIGEAIRDFATEVGFEFGNENTAVIDHHNFDSRLDDGKHTTVIVPSNQLISAELIVGNKAKLGPVLYKGVALTFNDENKLRLTVLNAGTTAYAFNPNSPITEVCAILRQLLFFSIHNLLAKAQF
jgi:oligosaccharyltransferase complex subunit beta